ncbi:ABC transporter permease subunit [Paenibacillus sp. 102]|uniref:ABC transporter permease subunit n=1 Tax=Paenibacillus sp. 102 TaxID=3120823 RepID=UPI0031BA5C45
MIKQIWKPCSKFITLIATLLLFLNVPYLFFSKGSFSFQPGQFIQQFSSTLSDLASLQSLSYQIPSFGVSKTVHLFPDVFNPYLYSFTILCAAFFLSLCVSTTMTYVYFLSPKWLKTLTHRIVFILEALPDMMIMVLLQIFFIWILREYGYTPVTIMSFNENKAYVLPIICLSVLPTLQMFRMMLLYIKEEQEKQYVEVAYGKGLSSSYILRTHIFKNIFVHLFYHLKTIFVFLLSNLFVLELVFHMKGIIYFLVSSSRFSTACYFVILLMILTPFYFLFQCISYMIQKSEKAVRGEIA